MKRFISLLLVLLIAAAAHAENLPQSVIERLSELGYYTDDADNAVSNFQKANGLSVTGVLDPSTQELIMSSKAVSQPDYLKTFFSEETYTKTYDRGSEGSGVRNLRSQLALLGYDITAGSEYDIATFYAVAVFQTLNSLEVTGKADPETLARLYSQRAIPCTSAEEVYELSTGDTGMQVKQLQNELAVLGYFTGNCTGIFASATCEAVKAFQKANSLEETGTWSLYQQLVVNYGMCISKYETDEFKAALSLSLGTRDECVKNLETRLKQLGYFEETPDELYDVNTETAVRIFQEANALIVTGIADPETRRLADDMECVSHSGFYQISLTSSITPGDEGYAVLLCSRRLIQLGYPMSEKWQYDDEMEQMMQIFRQACGFADEEGADMEMRVYLNSDSAPIYNRAKLMSDNYLAEKNYRDRLQSIVDTAASAVGASYEAGKSGPDSYGTAGLAEACYAAAGITIQPTVSKQLEDALRHYSYSVSMSELSAGRQIFMSKDGNLITGICISGDAFVYASAESGEVLQYDIETGLKGYEFIGSVMWD